MEIKTRKEAMIDGENTYFTGKQCKNGHTSYRYVQSGACYDCIRGDKFVTNSPTAVARKERLAQVAGRSANEDRRKVARDLMVLIKIRGYADDRSALSAVAYSLAMLREPELTQSDVDPRIAQQGSGPSGSAMFSFRCFVEDLDTFRHIANGLLFGSRPLHVDETRAALLAKRLRDVKVDPIPEWADRP